MIGISLIGGLGNQMFQYAAGKALAKKLNVDLFLDVRDFESYALNIFLLDRFKISSQRGSKNVLRKFPLSFKKPCKLLQKAGIVKVWYHETSYNYNKKFESLRKNLILSGYFQSEKYFQSIEEQIRQEYTPRNPLIGNNLEIGNQARELNSVMIHIRRGDYASDPKTLEIHGLCSTKYYEEAIQYIEDRVSNPFFFIFSDDINWAKSNLNLPENTIYINGNKSYPEIDMHLMSLCKHHIIANSTFSWWGAWLGNNTKKIVIAPKPWFNVNPNNTCDLIPKSWTLIQKN